MIFIQKCVLITCFSHSKQKLWHCDIEMALTTKNYITQWSWLEPKCFNLGLSEGWFCNALSMYFIWEELSWGDFFCSIHQLCNCNHWIAYTLEIEKLHPKFRSLQIKIKPFLMLFIKINVLRFLTSMRV